VSTNHKPLTWLAFLSVSFAGSLGESRVTFRESWYVDNGSFPLSTSYQFDSDDSLTFLTFSLTRHFPGEPRKHNGNLKQREEEGGIVR
jgi:hypothetical protein